MEIQYFFYREKSYNFAYLELVAAHERACVTRMRIYGGSCLALCMLKVPAVLSRQITLLQASEVVRSWKRNIYVSGRLRPLRALDAPLYHDQS